MHGGTLSRLLFLSYSFIFFFGLGRGGGGGGVLLWNLIVEVINKMMFLLSKCCMLGIGLII